MLLAEHLVVHADERVDAVRIGDRLQRHAVRRRDVERQVGDLGDEQSFGRLAREAGGQQPRGQVWRLVV